MPDSNEWPADHETLLAAIMRAFDEDTWWHGADEAVRAFERAFARAHDASYGAATCNGTVAFEIILRALGIGEGDQVILPAYNYYVHPITVRKVGASPVFVDVTPDNYTIDVSQISRLNLKRVRAVVAVHVGGCVAQLDELQALCAAHNILLIEDCAQAHGACYADRHVGSWGVAGIFSFGASKLMTAGQGGMIITSDADFHQRCFALINRGRDPRGRLNTHGISGENYQLPHFAATLLQPQLDALEQLCRQRGRTMELLDKALNHSASFASLQQFKATQVRSQYMYCFTYRQADLAQRNRLIEEARHQGLPLSKGYQSVTNDVRLFGAYQTQQYPIAQQADSCVIGIHHRDLLQPWSAWHDRIAIIEELANRRN